MDCTCSPDHKNVSTIVRLTIKIKIMLMTMTMQMMMMIDDGSVGGEDLAHDDDDSEDGEDLR